MPVLTSIGTIGTTMTPLNGAGRYKRKTIEQRLTATGYTPFLTVGETLPPYARVLFAQMKPATAIPFNIGSSAAAATGWQCGVAMVFGTAPTAITTSLTTINLVCLTANTQQIPVNQDPVNPWFVTAASTNGCILPTTLNLPATLNNGTAAKTFYVLPFMAITTAEAAQKFQVGTSTAPTVATTGYCFNTSTSATCSIDVQIVYEVLDETPDQ